MTETKSNTGILTLPEVATALGLDELAVLRLVARKRLAASVVALRGHQGNDSSRLRFVASELQRYIAAGAQDCTPPIFEQNKFSDPEYTIATACVLSMAKACQAQVKSDTQVRSEYAATLAKSKSRMFDEVNSAQSQEVALSVTPEVLKAANQPLISILPAWMREKYKTVFAATAVSHIRRWAYTFMDKVPTLERLYGAEYPTIVSGALELLKKSPAVIFSKATTIEDGPERGSFIRTVYTLPFSAFDLTNVINDAF